MSFTRHSFHLSSSLDLFLDFSDRSQLSNIHLKDTRHSANYFPNLVVFVMIRNKDFRLLSTGVKVKLMNLIVKQIRNVREILIISIPIQKDQEMSNLFFRIS